MVADEVRKLAKKSSEAATDIEKRIADINKFVEKSSNEALMSAMSKGLDKANQLSSLINHLFASFSEMHLFHQTMLESVRMHNEDLARSMVYLLDNVQFQDIIRQRIERALTGMDSQDKANRNCSAQVCTVNNKGWIDEADLEQVIQILQDELHDYRDSDSRHNSEVNNGHNEQAIEFF